MSAVEEWGHDKPLLIALLAPQIAAFASEIPDILRHQKKHRLLTHTFSVPALPSWHKFYRSHRLYMQPLLEMVYESSPFGRQLIDMGIIFREFSRNPQLYAGMKITPEMLAQGQQYWRELLRMSYDEVRDSIIDTPLEPETKAILNHYKTDHESGLAFMFLVALPCWLIYKEWPTHLYKTAIKGDVSAIHKLLRLDPFALHDPAIGKQIQQIRIHGRSSVFSSLLHAPLSPLKVKLTSSTIKGMLAGLISFFAEALKQPLTAPEIRKLFDAVAIDVDRDIDTSLPESPEAFFKTIQRNRPDWKPLILPRQNKLK